MLSKTSTRHAPWFIVPADHKWFTRVAIAELVARGARGPGPGVSEAVEGTAVGAGRSAQAPRIGYVGVGASSVERARATNQRQVTPTARATLPEARRRAKSNRRTAAPDRARSRVPSPIQAPLRRPARHAAAPRRASTDPIPGPSSSTVITRRSRESVRFAGRQPASCAHWQALSSRLPSISSRSSRWPAHAVIGRHLDVDGEAALGMKAQQRARERVGRRPRPSTASPASPRTQRRARARGGIRSVAACVRPAGSSWPRDRDGPAHPPAPPRAPEPPAASSGRARDRRLWRAPGAPSRSRCSSRRVEVVDERLHLRRIRAAQLMLGPGANVRQPPAHRRRRAPVLGAIRASRQSCRASAMATLMRAVGVDHHRGCPGMCMLNVKTMVTTAKSPMSRERPRARRGRETNADASVDPLAIR